MKLYCVRHCEACNADEDPARGLTEQGSQDAQKLAEYLQMQGEHIPHIMHSGKLRAEQTATRIAEAVKADQITVHPEWLADTADIDVLAGMVNSWVDNTMLVGHLPHMANLVSALVDVSDNMSLLSFAPGTMVCLQYVNDGRWMIDWVMKPENLC